MKLFLGFIWIYFSWNLALNAQNSHIQVISEPGVKVFLDGLFQGTSNAELEGYIIENVKPGNHIIKVVKNGFSAQEEEIGVTMGEVFTYQVKPFTPEIKITQKGNKNEQTIIRRTGSLKIQSLPVEIEIIIPNLNINSKKTEDEWLAEDLPAKKYEITFKWKEKKRSTIIHINEVETELFVDMIKGTILDNKKIDDINSRAQGAFGSGIENSNKNNKDQKETFPVGNRGVLSNNKNSNGLNENNESQQQKSTSSFSLNGRSANSLPKPKYPGIEEGILVVKITVDKWGKVTAAEPGARGTTIMNKQYWHEAKKAALNAKFNVEENAPAFQQGTITYRFVLD